MARAVSRTTPARPKEQIRNSRAIDPWSYGTRIVTPARLCPLRHRDMVFATWPEMAKTAKTRRNGPHSRFHISMVMASNNLTKFARDPWDLGRNICPMATLEVASTHLSPLRENGTGNIARCGIPHIEPPMALPSQGEDRRRYTPIRGGFMSPFQTAHNLGQRVHTTRGRSLMGRWDLVPLLPKRGLQCNRARKNAVFRLPAC